jgi:hypothetical protein
MKRQIEFETKISRIISAWIVVVNIILGIVIQNSSAKSSIFNIGPNSELFILEICIDTPVKYGSVMLFCLINSGIRTMNHSILQSWITNTVQDTSNTTPIDARQAYEISYISTIYTWFDFFMYMNILMSQIDLFVIEVLMDLIMITFVTKYYLHKKQYLVDNTYVSLIQ